MNGVKLMKRFSVGITEVNHGAITIMASSKEEAEELAMEAYFKGDVHWQDSDVTEIVVEEFPL